MARPPSIRQISRELLVGSLPEWLDGLLKPLNTFMGQVQDALSRNLTVTENLAMAWLDVTVTEGVAPNSQAVSGLGTRTVKGISVERVQVLDGGAAPTAAVAVLWAPTTVLKGSAGVPGVQITEVVGLASGTRATLTLLLKAE
jgi:hypothetical protein